MSGVLNTSNLSLTGSGIMGAEFAPPHNSSATAAPDSASNRSFSGIRNSAFAPSSLNASATDVRVQMSTDPHNTSAGQLNTSTGRVPSVTGSLNGSHSGQAPPGVTFHNVKPATNTTTPKGTSKLDSMAPFISGLRRARDDSDGSCDYVRLLIGRACCGTACFLSSIILLFVFSIIDIVVGLVYHDECEIDKSIPVALMIFGAFGIAKCVYNSGLLVWKHKDSGTEDEQEDRLSWRHLLDIIFTLALFIIFMWGAGSTLRNHTEVQHEAKNADDYCPRTCYWYAFWFYIIGFVFSGLYVIGCVLMTAAIVLNISGSSGS